MFGGQSTPRSNGLIAISFHSPQEDSTYVQGFRRTMIACAELPSTPPSAYWHLQSARRERCHTMQSSRPVPKRNASIRILEESLALLDSSFPRYESLLKPRPPHPPFQLIHDDTQRPLRSPTLSLADIEIPIQKNIRLWAAPTGFSPSTAFLQTHLFFANPPSHWVFQSPAISE